MWPEVEPRWRHAPGLLAREAERIEAAAERGGALALTFAAGSVRDGDWRLFEREDPEGLRLRRGRLVLRPLLAPTILVEADHELLELHHGLQARQRIAVRRGAASHDFERLGEPARHARSGRAAEAPVAPWSHAGA